MASAAPDADSEGRSSRSQDHQWWKRVEHEPISSFRPKNDIHELSLVNVQYHQLMLCTHARLDWATLSKQRSDVSSETT